MTRCFSSFNARAAGRGEVVYSWRRLPKWLRWLAAVVLTAVLLGAGLQLGGVTDRLLSGLLDREGLFLENHRENRLQLYAVTLVRCTGTLPPTQPVFDAATGEMLPGSEPLTHGGHWSTCVVVVAGVPLMATDTQRIVLE